MKLRRKLPTTMIAAVAILSSGGAFFGEQPGESPVELVSQTADAGAGKGVGGPSVNDMSGHR
jgi:hypothetical protein